MYKVWSDWLETMFYHDSANKKMEICWGWNFGSGCFALSNKTCLIYLLETFGMLGEYSKKLKITRLWAHFFSSSLNINLFYCSKINLAAWPWFPFQCKQLHLSELQRQRWLVHGMEFDPLSKILLKMKSSFNPYIANITKHTVSAV